MNKSGQLGKQRSKYRSYKIRSAGKNKKGKPSQAGLGVVLIYQSIGTGSFEKVEKKEKKAKKIELAETLS